MKLVQRRTIIASTAMQWVREGRLNITAEHVRAAGNDVYTAAVNVFIEQHPALKPMLEELPRGPKVRYLPAPKVNRPAVLGRIIEEALQLSNKKLERQLSKLITQEPTRGPEGNE
jgi:hypothetical protein